MLENLNITLADVIAEKQRRSRNKIKLWFPDTGPLRRELYCKHMAVIEATAKHRQVCMISANRVGKSELGAFMVACHATGDYPEWWKGRIFSKPVNVMVAGETGTLVRDSVQLKLMGPVHDFGTGMLPFLSIMEKSSRPGIPNAVDTVQVRHKSGGASTIQFQSYDQGREKFQATERDVIWDDEEPPLDVYSEQIMRTMTTNGIIISTFTPLEGLTETALLFAPGGAIKDGVNPDTGRYTLNLTWDDAPHLTMEQKDELFEALPPHQREARSKGVPALGSGAIYPVLEEDVICDDFKIPEYWPRIYGLDVGWNRTAAVWLARDSDSDIVYAYSEHYRGNAEPLIHAEAIKGRGEWINGVIDPAANGRQQADGLKVIDQYRASGLILHNADHAVEAGIYKTWQRLSTGKLKIFKSLTNLRGEYRIYRRDEKGKIVKENDHALDALRYAIMSDFKYNSTPERDADYGFEFDNADRSSISGY